MNLKILLVLIGIGLLAITINACKTKGIIEPEDFKITYEIGAGKSKVKPAYSIFLDNNTIKYNGIKNTQVIGKHSYEISKQVLDEIKSSFNNSNFSSFQTEYIGRMRDLPISTISFKGHTVKFQKREAPAELIQLVALIKDLAPENN